MARILVTLLGKAVANYKSATYVFEDKNTRTSRFFGLELAKQVKPDQLVILGTTGSMWDNLLLETELSHRTDLEQALLNIGEAAQQDRVEQATLNQLAIELSNTLNLPCRLSLIPYGRTQLEQTQTLEQLVGFFASGDTAILDISHGLRHLPMLVQQSSLLLQTLKNVQIEAIYYGALELSQESLTPVMRLDGLLEIDRWSEALYYYDRTGDYAAFADLLAQSGFSKHAVDCLKDAAFFEQTNNIHKAWVKLRQFLTMLKSEEALCSPHARLFLPALKKRFAWVSQQNPKQRQVAVAWLALDNGNLLRATLYGFEAFITQLTEQAGGDIDNHDARNTAKENYECTNGQKKSNKRCEHNLPSPNWEHYVLLRSIRNQLAHSSTHTHQEVKKAVASRVVLSETLQSIFKTLIPRQTV